MGPNNLKNHIRQALKYFGQSPTAQGVKHFFATLGYSTQRDFILDTHIPAEVLGVFGWEKFSQERGLLDEWESVDCLFQVGDDEIGQNPQLGLFQSYDDNYLQSYGFVGLTLHNPYYSRSQLAGITREINRHSDIPIMVLFRYGDYLTLAIINRRPNKLDRDRDALEKITLIKDIHIHSPHRAHIEILSELSLASLKDVRNFDDLHTAWQKVLDTSELNKKFFQEVSNWYFWAIQTVTFPDGGEKDRNIRNATSVIRLVTRLIFVWFLKEKGLVPSELFDENQLKQLLKSLDSEASTYYKAILQNLFFATLNTEMNTDKKPDSRKFRGKAAQKGGRAQHYGIANVYRYQDYFTDAGQFLRLCSNIPFLNGGLFECLDKAPEKIRIDGFSDREDNPLSVPNHLFFGEARRIDLNKVYGTSRKIYEVQGLIEIFNRYKFTIDENTPIEEEVALDPELLGKVFENLLAEYNPETETTARKQTGSFYTPREIVNYMVDEALIAYLQNVFLDPPLPPLRRGENTKEITFFQVEAAGAKIEDKLRHLLSYNDKVHQFNDREVESLINAIDNLKIIDIACGSGAFPMGVLQKLVFILGKLDPSNTRWKQKQKEKAIQPVLRDIQVAKQISYEEAREEAIQKLQERLAEIEQEFENNEMDYPRKLFLIENCIFGVDIQPIAVQIAKLRFFISLVVDQRVNDSQPNRGILPLPNLETKFVAANSLIGVETQLTLRSPAVIEKEGELKKVRQQHFSARTPATKKKCRERDGLLRQEISELLKSTGLESVTADTLSRWNPYDLNASSDFFDAEWMFGVTDGFDICIGNPPYVFARNSASKGLTEVDKKYFSKHYQVTEYQLNLYPLFIEKGYHLLKANGILDYITPNNWLTINTNKNLREFILNASTIKIVNFYAKVFESADVDSSIIIFSKPKSNNNIQLFEYTDDFCLVYKTSTKFFLKQKDYVINIEAFKDQEAIVLLEKIESQSIQLKSIADIKSGLKAYEGGKGNPSQTEEMKKNRIYHSMAQINKDYLKYLDGKNVCRYYLGWSGEFLKYGKNLAAPRTNFMLFSSQRILVRQIPSPLPYCINACLVEEIALNDLNSMNIINIKQSPQLVLGILNSKLISYWFAHKFGKLQRGTFPQFKINELAIFPIPKNYKEYENKLIDNVKKILETKRKTPNADTSDLEREIDQITYQLYGLTEEEIAIIEESVTQK